MKCSVQHLSSISVLPLLLFTLLPGCLADAVGGRRIFYHPEQPLLSWEEAFSSCHNKGQYLLSPRNQDEFDELNEILNNKLITSAVPLGATSYENYQTFVYRTTGTALDPSVELSDPDYYKYLYASLNDEEPSVTLSNLDGSLKLPYFCEAKKNKFHGIFEEIKEILLLLALTCLSLFEGDD